MAAKLGQPTLFIVAGAPGSGKSALMPVTLFGVDHFNADDEAAKLNEGSYHGIPQSIRNEVNGRFERFIRERVTQGRSLAIETTLRSAIALTQAQDARTAGFFVQMHYIATDQLATNLKRVMVRVGGGGHGAPVAVLTDIRQKSFRNLRAAIKSIPYPFERTYRVRQLRRR